MNKIGLIDRLMKTMQVKYRETLDQLRPADKNNGITEANLTLQFFDVFKAEFPGSVAFLEVPILNKKTDKRNHHVDGLVLNNKVGCFIESKRIYDKGHREQMRNDLRRISDSGILMDFKNNLHPAPKVWPETIYAIAIAEVYRDKSNKQKDFFTELRDVDGYSTGVFLDKEKFVYKDDELNHLFGFGYASKLVELP